MMFTELYHIISEGTKEAMQVLSRAFPNDREIQNTLLQLDQTTSKGDVSTIIKLYNSSNYDINNLRTYLNKYYQFKNKNIPIQLVSNFIKFTELIDAEDYKQSLKRKTSNAVEIEEGQDENKIIDDNDVMIYKAFSAKACIKYGKGYSFCISRPGGGNMYNNYRMSKASTFYFIFFKKIPKNDDAHIMVLDRTDAGFEWTFKNNSTQTTTWDEIIRRFPVLAKYKSLFNNNPVTDVERVKMENMSNFIENQSLELFKGFDLETKTDILKSGTAIIDDIFKTLPNELINEYISVGPNLTPYQVENLPKNFIQFYIKKREISIPLLLDAEAYEYNKLDVNNAVIIAKLKKDEDAVLQKVSQMEKGGDLNLGSMRLLFLPDISHITVRSFDCIGNKLTSLEGAPESVGRDFYCSGNKLTSLEGAPKSVVGNFDCSHNKLTSLKGAPESVVGNFDCSHNKLTSLKGAPESVVGDFDCIGNKLTSLEGAPESVGRDFYCSHNKLTSLKGAPESVVGDFYCSGNNLTSLEGAPESVGRNFYCSGNNLTSLEGAPKSVVGNFYCSHNKLTSLKGAPESVVGDFYCRYNYLTSLEGAPKSVVGDIYSNNNPVRFTNADTQQAMENSKKRNAAKNINVESFKTFFHNFISNKL